VFLTAAHRLISEGGPGALTVAALCERAGVSKGSFYHHFEDLGAFVDDFAAAWGAWLEQLFARIGEQPDPLRRLEFAADEGFVVTSPAVRAMGAWASTNPAVAEAFAAPERSWWATAVGTFTEVAGDELSGQIVATMNNAFARGLLARPRRVDRERYVELAALLYGSYGVRTELSAQGGRAQLAVLSWDRARARRVDLDPLRGDDESLITAVNIGDGTPRGVRSVKGDYFRAADELFAEHGADGLTVTGLADRLGVSTGSFQHHFGSRPRFVHEYAEHRVQTGVVAIKSALCDRDPGRSLELLLPDLLAAPDLAESAWRALGHSDPVVGAAVCRVDEVRKRALEETFDRLAVGPDNAALAELTLDFALGLSREAPLFGPGLRSRTACEWMRRVVGVEASVRVEDGRPRLALSPG
jgi:AcrR family transcriptional regulator